MKKHPKITTSPYIKTQQKPINNKKNKITKTTQKKLKKT